MTAGAVRVARAALLVLRWWFALVYLLAGCGCVVGGLVCAVTGRAGEAVYLVIGGVLVAVAGWAVHPWGLQRRNRQLAPARLGGWLRTLPASRRRGAAVGGDGGRVAPAGGPRTVAGT